MLNVKMAHQMDSPQEVILLFEYISQVMLEVTLTLKQSTLTSAVTITACFSPVVVEEVFA
jgi:hypothetical protein